MNLSALLAPLLALFASPFWTTQEFINSDPSLSNTERVAIIAPANKRISVDAQKFLEQMDKIHRIANDNGLELKSSFFDGIKFGEGKVSNSQAKLQEGLEKVTTVTCQFRVMNEDEVISAITFIFIYTLDNNEVGSWILSP